MMQPLYVLACVTIITWFIMIRIRTRRLLRRLSHMRSRSRGKYIYAFTDVGQLLPVVKIGRATDVKARLASHRTAAPFGLIVFMVRRVPDSHRAEALLHERYNVWRVNPRNEWFWLTPLMLIELLLMSDNSLKRKIRS